MGSKRAKEKKGKKLEINYGTKQEMVISNLNDEDVKINSHHGHDYKLTILAYDEKGFYYTSKGMVESKIFDPYRINVKREKFSLSFLKKYVTCNYVKQEEENNESPPEDIKKAG